MEKTFNKLVRDNIPDKIKNNGEKAIIRILSDEEYKLELYRKLIEEANEVINASTKEELIEELADLNEVLNSILKTNGITENEVKNIANQKRKTRGGFDKKIFLEKTISE